MKKDLRAVWPLWLAWFGLIAVRILLLFYYLHDAGEKSLRTISSVGGCAIIADIVLVFSLVCKLVHEDPLVGDKAFWVTRPVKGGQLLAAKVLLAVIVCVVSPLSLLLPTWLGFGLDAENIGQILIYHGVFNSALLVAALLFAVVTKNSGSFGLVAICSLILIALVATAVDSVFELGLFRARQAYWSAICVGLGAVLVAIALQYLRRTVRLVWGVLAGAILVAGCLLPSSSGKFRTVYRVKPAQFPQVLDVKWQEGSLWLSEKPAPHVKGTIVVVCANEMDQLQLQYRGGVWTDAGGRESPAEYEGSERYPLINPERITFSKEQPIYSFPVILTVPSGDLNHPVGFSGKIWVEQRQSKDIASTPLAAGSLAREENLRARLVEVNAYEKGVKISFVEIVAADSRARSLRVVAPSGESSKWSRMMASTQSAMLLWLEVSFKKETHGVQGWLGRDEVSLAAKTDENLAAKGWNVRWSRLLSVGAVGRELKADQLVINKENAQ